MLRPFSSAKVAVCVISFAVCHCLLHLSISFPTRVARGDEPLSGPRAGVESGQPKKFGAMFFKNCLPLLGGLDHFLGLFAFKARELFDRHNVVLPWLPKITS